MTFNLSEYYRLSEILPKRKNLSRQDFFYPKERHIGNARVKG